MPSPVGEVLAAVAAVEDLVTMKVLAGRPTDLNDVESMLRARRDEIDLDEVRRTLTVLEAALSRSDLLPRFEQIFRRVR